MTPLVQFVLKEFGWFINGLLALFLIYLAVRLFKGEPIVLLKAMIREAREFGNRQFAVGSINFLGFVVLTGFGVMIVVLGEISHLVNFIVSLVGREKAKALIDDRGLAVFVSLICFVVFSLVTVLARDYLLQKRKQKQ